jgi:hypothetical protein
VKTFFLKKEKEEKEKKEKRKRKKEERFGSKESEG